MRQDALSKRANTASHKRLIVANNVAARNAKIVSIAKVAAKPTKKLIKQKRTVVKKDSSLV